MILLEVPVWLEIVSKLGPFAAGLSVIVAAITLRANHEWNRRNFASQMVTNWNKQTKPVIDDIEKIEPRIIDFRNGRLTQITQDDAEKIYFSKYEADSKEWKLRTRFIHLLNEFEHIAAAYKNSVGDRGMIEESFKDILVKWGYVLEHFIHVYKKQRMNDKPWGPFHDLYNRWTREKPEILAPKAEQIKAFKAI